MEVRLIAHTSVEWDEMEDATGGIWFPQADTTSAEDVTEFAGRLCYQSWNRPNPATRENRAYIGHIIENEDFSVMEHASASVYVTGAGRAFSHQMIRHRHFSYSQLSQRYVDESGRAWQVIPKDIKNSRKALARYAEACDYLEEAYEDIAAELLAEGLPRKRARDAARYILPGGQETRMLITGNHRAWREFFMKRRSERASEEIHEFADKAFEIMKGLAPSLYQDME